MDRFVEFLRRVAAEYNSPPPTPRDEIWGRIVSSVFAGAAAEEGAAAEAASGSDSDMDRFVEFLRREAAEYNAAPPIPRDDMWDRIESTLELHPADDPKSVDETDRSTVHGLSPVYSSADSRVTDDSTDDVLSTASFLYRTPPPTPSEEMWGRIEAAWQMRRSAGPTAREAGLEPLPARPVPDLADPAPARPRRDRRRALMVTGLAVAASLVIGIAIGRRSAEQLRPDPTPATVAQGGAAAGDEPGSAPSGPAGAIETPTQGELTRTQGLGTQAGEPGLQAPGGAPGGARSETLEIPPRQDARLAAMEPPPLDTAKGGPGDAVVDKASRRAVAVYYATAEHLEQAEALLTTFRTEPDAGNGQVSRWARELLAETRLLMDLPGGRDPQTTALLQEMELVLASIAGLGEDAPSGERAFIADGLDQQGTLPRLRAAMPSGLAGAGRVGT
jgi:hypothetical protein